MIYTLFYSNLADLEPERLEEYGEQAAALRSRAEASYPGFVDQKTFTADDGERLTVVRFRDPESQAAWRQDSVHRNAQRKGRDTWYERYRIVVCEEVRSRSWSRAATHATSAEHPEVKEGGNP